MSSSPRTSLLFTLRFKYILFLARGIPLQVTLYTSPEAPKPRSVISSSGNSSPGPNSTSCCPFLDQCSGCLKVERGFAVVIVTGEDVRGDVVEFGLPDCCGGEEGLRGMLSVGSLSVIRTKLQD